MDFRSQEEPISASGELRRWRIRRRPHSGCSDDHGFDHQRGCGGYGRCRPLFAAHISILDMRPYSKCHCYAAASGRSQKHHCGCSVTYLRPNSRLTITCRHISICGNLKSQLQKVSGKSLSWANTAALAAAARRTCPTRLDKQCGWLIVRTLPLMHRLALTHTSSALRRVDQHQANAYAPGSDVGLPKQSASEQVCQDDVVGYRVSY
jgi:hypothetical protein